MKKLIAADHQGDYRQFENILSDPFMRRFIPHLRTRMKAQAIVKAVGPYRCMKLSGLAQVRSRFHNGYRGVQSSTHLELIFVLIDV